MLSCRLSKNIISQSRIPLILRGKQKGNSVYYKEKRKKEPLYLENKESSKILRFSQQKRRLEERGNNENPPKKIDLAAPRKNDQMQMDATLFGLSPSIESGEVAALRLRPLLSLTPAASSPPSRDERDSSLPLSERDTH